MRMTPDTFDFPSRLNVCLTWVPHLSSRPFFVSPTYSLQEKGIGPAYTRFFASQSMPSGQDPHASSILLNNSRSFFRIEHRRCSNRNWTLSTLMVQNKSQSSFFASFGAISFSCTTFLALGGRIFPSRLELRSLPETTVHHTHCRMCRKHVVQLTPCVWRNRR